MKRCLSGLAFLLLIVIFPVTKAHALCQVCYQQSFLGIHYTTWDTLPDSCSNWILLSASATCANLLAAAPPSPGRYESVVAWLDGSGILDSLDTGELIISTRNHGQLVLRPVFGQPGQLEYSTLPGSPYPAAGGTVIIGAVRPGRPLHYPPISPDLAAGTGPTCSGPAGSDFCLAYTRLDPSDGNVVANQMYPINIQALTFTNVAAGIPTLSEWGLGALLFLVVGVGVAVMYRRS